VYEYEYGPDGEILQCPWHGWEFDLLTGQHLVDGSDARLRGYPVEVHDEDVYVVTR
jgi:nitrite reductase/ring-hydroxylating ferredoxin subunit